MIVREFAPGDAETVVALWTAAGLTRPWNDPRADIERKRTVQPELFLVAVDDAAARVIGTVMGGYDGHRGWLYYLAVDADRRGEGIGRTLVHEVEARLVAMGCPKVQLMVRRGNDGVLEFYDELGYEPVDVAMVGKRLIIDG